MKRKRSLNKHDLSSKRRRKKRGKGFFYLVLLGLVAIGVVFLMRIDFWKITEVKVGEAKQVDEAGILEIAKKQIVGTYLGIFPRNNFLIYPKGEIEKEIMDSEPAVLSVTMKAELDHILTILIKERLASALWCKKSGECYFMDKKGIIFAPAISPSLDNRKLFKYYGIAEGNPLGRQFGEEKFFPELAQFVKKVKDLGLQISAAEVVSADRAQIDFEDNSYLIFPPYEKDKAALFENIEIFINDLKSKNDGQMPLLEYIDARYGNKIFYKIKNE